MSDVYTPSTRVVKAFYASSLARRLFMREEEALAEFNRWYSEEIRYHEARAEERVRKELAEESSRQKTVEPDLAPEHTYRTAFELPVGSIVQHVNFGSMYTKVDSLTWEGESGTMLYETGSLVKASLGNPGIFLRFYEIVQVGPAPEPEPLQEWERELLSPVGQRFVTALPTAPGLYESDHWSIAAGWSGYRLTEDGIWRMSKSGMPAGFPEQALPMTRIADTKS